MQYKSRTVSIFWFVSTFSIFILLAVFFIQKLFGELESQFLAIMIMVGALLICYKTTCKLTMGWARIIMSKSDIEFKWINKPLLTFQNNESIELDKIESWKYRREFQYSCFKIYEESYTPITIIRLFQWNEEKDEFLPFLNAFEKRIGKINQERQRRIIIADKREKTKEVVSLGKNSASKTPKLVKDKEKEFYKSNLSKILVFIYVVTGIFGLIYVMNNLNSGKSNVLFMLYAIVGCVFYIKTHLRKTNKKY